MKKSWTGLTVALPGAVLLGALELGVSALHGGTTGLPPGSWTAALVAGMGLLGARAAWRGRRPARVTAPAMRRIRRG